MQTSNEYRVIGPPGTGKTTYLCRQAINAVKASCERDGSLPGECSAVLISSLTRAAANELRGRGLEIHPKAIGTLHSHALRALGQPRLCVDSKDLKEWNDICRPEWRLSGNREQSPDTDGGSPGNSGDGLLSRYHTYRAMLVPRDKWTMRVATFADEYETWKRLSDRLDFSDVIHDAAAQNTTAPGDASIIFVDEAQDHDRAELRLIRQWSEGCHRLVVVGDPDQNLYEWRGSEPEAFYESEIPADHTKVLAQSYRVPGAVHAVAQKIIGRCKNRRPVEYHPRQEEGRVEYTGFSAAKGYGAQMLAEELAGKLAQRTLIDDRPATTMVLSSCEYLLKPLISILREQGTPFWNPFARDRGAFNPLHPAKGVSMKDRLLAFTLPSEEIHGSAARLWTADDFLLWSEALDLRDTFRHGARSEAEKMAQAGAVIDGHALRSLCKDTASADALSRLSPAWFVAHAKADKQRAANYAATVLRRNGVAGLRQQPRLVIGTIHSVKGGEADTVYLMPDLSPGGCEAHEKDPDPTWRLFYVGATRARLELKLCEQSSGMAIDW